MSPALLVLLAAAQAPMKEDPPKSVPATEARKEYDAAMKKLDDEFQAKAAEARQKYLKKLDGVRAAALEAKDLDEAQRILAASKELAAEPPATTAFQVVIALFGWGDKWQDVTPAVRKSVKDGSLRMKEAGTGLGDPAFGQTKSLVVIYRHKGTLRYAVAGDRSPVSIPAVK